VQLRLPWRPATSRRDERRVTVGGHEFPVVVARHRRARRYVLRLTEAGALRLTVPRGASVAGGMAFVARQAAWIEREEARRRARSAPWLEGTTVLFRGEPAALSCRDGQVRLGTLSAAMHEESDVREIVEGLLRDLATRELPGRCHDLARERGLSPSKVTVRNQRSRWGACTWRGHITLNWRLIQTPPVVADYVILHELAHLSRRDHSRAFWREVERLCPTWRESETWLRRHGREIQPG
jgi:hypothetical protein